MSIVFNTIPLNIRTPGVFAEFDASHAVQGVSIQPHDALLIGQMLSTGSATAGHISLVRSATDAIALYGAKSPLAQMVAAYKSVDSLTPLYCCPLADGTTAATGSITWTGTATEAGELPIYIGGRRVSVAVPNGTTAASLETLALAAYALETDLPVTAVGDSGTGLDFTAVAKGTCGNQIFLGVALLPGERVPAGLVVTVTAMASGATDPAYSTAVTSMGEDQYHTIAALCTDATNVGYLVTELESRFGAMRSIEGQLFISKYDTAANLTTLGNSFNSPTLTCVGGEVTALMPLPWELAAQTAAISARQAQNDPARAMTGVAYANAFAAPRGSRFTRAQRDVLLSDGISTVRAASDGRLVTERLITTYQTNSLSIADTAYFDLYTVRTLAALRYSLRARIAQRFANFKLASDGNEISGQPVVTPSIIKSEILALFLEWRDLGWVENFEQFKAELLVQRNGSDPNRVDAILPPDLINAFLVGAFQIAFKR